MKSRYDSYIESHHKIDRQRRTEVIPASPLLRTTHKEKDKDKLNPNVKVDIDGLFEQLTFHIHQQRKLLKRSQQDGFDQMWGIDPTGEFSRQRQLSWLLWTNMRNTSEIIKQELIMFKTLLIPRSRN